MQVSHAAADRARRHRLPVNIGRDAPIQSDALSEALRMLGSVVQFKRNTEIYGEEDPVEYFYHVVSGAVRTYKQLSDGRRQIGAFHLPGDVFGLEAGSTHHFSAEAVADSAIRIAKHSAVMALAERDHDLSTELWTRTANNLERAEDHMLLLGRKNAEERVASFLLQMADRSSSKNTVLLPMSRQDIADYLGLTIETVSRTLALLQDEATIELPSTRRVQLCNHAALHRLDA